MMDIRRGVFRLWALFAAGCVARAVYLYFWGPMDNITTSAGVIQLGWDCLTKREIIQTLAVPVLLGVVLVPAFWAIEVFHKR
jgi:hypothetical protein